MRSKVIALVVVGATVALLGACGDDSPDRINVAEEFLDAIYSFDSDRLEGEMHSLAEDDQRFLTFYQGFVEASGYEVVGEPACQISGPNILCIVTARDGFVDAAGVEPRSAEAYTLSVQGGTVEDVRFRINDPPAISEPFDWVVENRTDVMDGPCQGFFDGGPTPGDCARAFLDAFEKRLTEASSG